MKKSVWSLVPVAAVVACSSEPEAQDPSDVQPGYTQPGYTQPSQTQPGYAQPGYTQPATTATATSATPAAAGMIAIPCQADSGCGTHRCNLSTQLCALPCTGAQDCQAGYACTMGVCLPGGTQ